MIIHVALIFLMFAALASFLVLWYFWVKKKLTISYALDDEEQVLFPFRQFSWLVMGLMVLTCLAQVHFVRVSSGVHEKLAAMSDFHKGTKVCAEGLDDLKTMLDNVSRDLNSGMKRLAAMSAEQHAGPQYGNPAQIVPAVPGSPPPQNAALLSLNPARPQAGFAKEARASSAKGLEESAGSKPKLPVAKPPSKKPETPWSMRLNLKGVITADKVRVRKDPAPNSRVMATLSSGSEVNVTEKVMVGNQMWLHIATSSGATGWVDLRYIKLRASSKSAPAGAQG